MSSNFVYSRNISFSGVLFPIRWLSMLSSHLSRGLPRGLFPFIFISLTSLQPSALTVLSVSSQICLPGLDQQVPPKNATPRTYINQIADCHETVSFVFFVHRGADKSDGILRVYEGDLLAGLGGVHHARWNVQTHEVNVTPPTLLLTNNSQHLFRSNMNVVIILWHTLVLIQSDLS